MRTIIALVLLSLALPAMAYAAGGHEGLACTGCHGIHDAKGNLIFAVEPNTKAINPRTKQAYKGVTSLCLGCHENNGGMGILPVMGQKSHPYDIKPDPKVAAVPADVLSGGKFHCTGCHDPHPSNPNYRYLRVDTKGGGNMQNFCSLCHSSKSGTSIPASAIFSSMDEGASNAKPLAKPKPAAKKKK